MVTFFTKKKKKEKRKRNLFYAQRPMTIFTESRNLSLFLNGKDKRIKKKVAPKNKKLSKNNVVIKKITRIFNLVFNR
jgi:hypothetical protein